MAIFYFDSSAFAKLVIEEDGSDIALAHWNSCDSAVSSRLSYPEVCAALAAADRAHRIEPASLPAARRQWDERWAAVRSIGLTDKIRKHAGALTAAHALRGADAVHLASALALGEADLVVAAWDRRLNAGASAEGLRTLRVA